MIQTRYTLRPFIKEIRNAEKDIHFTCTLWQ